MDPSQNPHVFHATTIVSVRREGRVAIAGDGQVTLGHTVMKSNARKVRKLADGNVLAGFAGAAADAFTLFEVFEARLEKHGGQLQRAGVVDGAAAVGFEPGQHGRGELRRVAMTARVRRGAHPVVEDALGRRG